MDKFTSIPIEVEAKQYPSNGHWKVVYADGNSASMTPEQFAATFVPLIGEAPAEAAPKVAEDIKDEKAPETKESNSKKAPNPHAKEAKGEGQKDN